MSYKRINYILSQINETDKVLDIGADHGFVPIFLFKKYPKIVADASDVNKKPLAIAKANIQKEKLTKKINLFLSDGVKDVDITKYNTFVIAGMGGNEISKIIKQKKLKAKLILHPTSNYQKLRKILSSNGYKIIKETIIKERNIFNVIIIAIPGFQYLTKKNQYLGPLLRKENSQDVEDYYQNTLNHNEKLFIKTNKKQFKKNSKYLKNK